MAKVNRLHLVIAACIFIYAAIGLPVVFWGRLNLDEGFYLLASLNVLAGEKPYRDFLFSQMPFLPYFYGPLLLIGGKSLAAGRWISFFLGMASVVLVVRAAWRLQGVHAAVVTGLLYVCNLNLVFDSCIVKTQPLTIFLTALALAAIVAGSSAQWLAMSTAFMTLAVLTRLSMLPALVLLWVMPLFSVSRRRHIGVVCGSILTLALAAWYFSAAGPMYFGVYESHNDFHHDPAWSLAGVRSFCAGVVDNQRAILLCGSLGAIVFPWRLAQNRRPLSRGDWVLLYCLLGYLGTTAIHASRAIAYPTYQSSNVAFLLLFAGVWAGGLLARLSMRRRWIGYAILMFAILFRIDRQEYVVHRNGHGGPGQYREALALLRRERSGNGKILTFNTELAIDSGLRVLPKYELGCFSYLPDFPDATADRLNVLTFKQLFHDIHHQKAEFIGTTRDYFCYGTRYSADDIRREIESRYDLVGKILRYGQFFETLYIYRVKSVTPD